MKQLKIFHFVSLFGALFCLLLAGCVYFFPREFLGVQKTIVFYSQKQRQSFPIKIPTAAVSPIPVAQHSLDAAQAVSPTILPLPPAQMSPAQATPTTAPVSQPQEEVQVQILEPDGTFHFSLPPGGSACDELTEAKNEGKIRSVTFDSSYMSSMQSLYIKEMNGYANNWIFTVNGQGPAGCSLASPKAGDTVVWRFS